ncbi:hypothetical protein HZS_3671 [Henneguya salminicola]|nr:hypothetical protein HZS_3671 [Henneguya salminicola]
MIIRRDSLNMLEKIFLLFVQCVLSIYIPDHFSHVTSQYNSLLKALETLLSDEINVEIPIEINHVDLLRGAYQPIFYK